MYFSHKTFTVPNKNHKRSSSLTILSPSAPRPGPRTARSSEADAGHSARTCGTRQRRQRPVRTVRRAEKDRHTPRQGDAGLGMLF